MLTGVEAVFAMTFSDFEHEGAEFQAGKRLADATLAAGVQHFVFRFNHYYLPPLVPLFVRLIPVTTIVYHFQKLPPMQTLLLKILP
jgi:hypothetical protein